MPKPGDGSGTGKIMAVSTPVVFDFEEDRELSRILTLCAWSSDT